MDRKYDFEVGIDTHKRFSQIAVVDSEGKIISQRRYTNSPDLLEKFFDSISGSYRVTFESARNYFLLADFLDEKGIPFVIS